MSARGSKLVAVASICAVGMVFAATNAQSERLRTTSRADRAPIEATPVSETAAERRERLNARMAEMLRSGDGARLVQPTAPRRRATTPRPRVVASQPRAITATPVIETSVPAVTAIDDGYQSTIAPPPFTGGPMRRAGRGYTPPRLDLTTPPRIPTSDVECLTQAIYYEARNESAEGQAAVGEVVMNRTRSGTYPRSVCAVVYQRNSRTCQFTFTCDGAIGRNAVDTRKWARAEQIAREVYEGRSAALLPSSSVNYHANYVRPSWGARLERVRQIGAHIFYGAALAGGSTPGAAAPARTAQAPTQGLQFVRIDALDRAFQAMSSAAAQPESQDAASRP